jgi:hypothetical protein
MNFIGHGNRHMAWRLLAVCDPVPYRELASIAGIWYGSWNATRAMAILLCRDADRTLADGELLASFASADSWRHKVLARILAGCAMAPAEQGEEWDSCHASSPLYAWSELMEYMEALPVAAPPAPPCEKRASVLRMLRLALDRERDPHRQLSLAWFLRIAEDHEATDQIIAVAMSSLANDDVVNNANSARWLLDEVKGLDSAPILAGFRVGIEMEDWQLIDQAAELLLQRDHDFRLADYPEAMAFMATQLEDDDVEGNATAAVNFLRNCGPAAKPTLYSIMELGDRQAARIAKHLLAELGE